SLCGVVLLPSVSNEATDSPSSVRFSGRGAPVHSAKVGSTSRLLIKSVIVRPPVTLSFQYTINGTRCPPSYLCPLVPAHTPAEPTCHRRVNPSPAMRSG